MADVYFLKNHKLLNDFERAVAEVELSADPGRDENEHIAAVERLNAAREALEALIQRTAMKACFKALQRYPGERFVFTDKGEMLPL